MSTITLTPVEVRDAFATDLAGTGYPVYVEPPDALVPPAFVVSWEGSTPASDQWGVWLTELGVEVWPASDLTAAGHTPMRDAMALSLLALIGSWFLEGCAITSWTYSLADRQLGGQPFRVGLAAISVLIPAPC